MSKGQRSKKEEKKPKKDRTASVVVPGKSVGLPATPPANGPSKGR